MKYVLAALLLFLSVAGQAQRNMRDSTQHFFALSAHIGLQIPMADLAKRFGYGGLVGGSLMYKTKGNWTYTASYDFLYGSRVREDSILRGLETNTGAILDKNGNSSDVLLFQRGFMITGQIGRIHPLQGKTNVNSGLHWAVGTGFMQHKIRIQVPDGNETVPSLSGDYLKGYDRLTFGWMMCQSIGYSHFSNYRLINYYIGLELAEGITQNRRTINFDTGQHDGRTRLDLVGSVVFRWYFPIYKSEPKDFYFY